MRIIDAKQTQNGRNRHKMDTEAEKIDVKWLQNGYRMREIDVKWIQNECRNRKKM